MDDVIHTGRSVRAAIDAIFPEGGRRTSTRRAHRPGATGRFGAGGLHRQKSSTSNNEEVKVMNVKEVDGIDRVGNLENVEEQAV